MNSPQAKPKTSEGGSDPITSSVALGLASWAYQAHGPLMDGDVVRGVPLIAVTCMTVFGTQLAGYAARRALDYIDYINAHTPYGLHGDAGFVTSLDQIEDDLLELPRGPYCGAFEGEAIFADYQSNALTIAPAGEGKSTGVTMPNIFSCAGEDMLIFDMKPELHDVAEQHLEAIGERVIRYDLSGQYAKPSHEYAGLCILHDDYTRPGGLEDITADAAQMAAALRPSKSSGAESGGGDNDRFWLEGERSLIRWALQFVAMIKDENAPLGDVCHLLNDPDELEQALKWCAGRLPDGEDENGDQRYKMLQISALDWAKNHEADEVAVYAKEFRGLSKSLLKLATSEDDRTFQSFITGARSALSWFNPTTRADKLGRRTTFRFTDLKEGPPTKIFIGIDSTRLEAQRPVLEFLQYCAMTELKRHKNHQRKVRVILDEGTNYVFAELESLLTFGRAFGITIHFIAQSLGAVRKVYGETALRTLLNETEIKQFIGARDPETLKLIKDMLGTKSVITRDYKAKRFGSPYEMDNTIGFSEKPMPLLTEEQIRRTKRCILFIRKNRPLLVDLPSIAAIHPYRDWQGINPFYGKPYRLPITLRIKRRKRRTKA